MAVWRWDRWLFDQRVAENGQAALYGPEEKMSLLSHTYLSQLFSGSLEPVNDCVCVCV